LFSNVPYTNINLTYNFLLIELTSYAQGLSSSICALFDFYFSSQSISLKFYKNSIRIDIISLDFINLLVLSLQSYISVALIISLVLMLLIL